MKLTIYFEDKQDKFCVRAAMRAAIRKAIFNTLIYEGMDSNVEVSVTFTDNEEIHILNKSYRNKDSATDVLSFPMYDFAGGEIPALGAGEALPLGDIVLSLERARMQALELGHSIVQEVVFLSIHSTLHLLGYDHERSKEDDDDMQRRQMDIMKILGYEKLKV